MDEVIEIRVTLNNNQYIYGTGFFIDDSGQILTNRHVIWDFSESTYYTNISGRLYDQDDYIDLDYVGVSDEYDLALLKVPDDFKDYSVAKFSTREVTFGDKIYSVGNTFGYGLTLLIGNVSAPIRLVENNDNVQIPAIQMNIDIEVGNSGGPVYNKYGRVIGISTFRILDDSGNIMQGMNFALPSSSIQEFLNSIS
jgi:serine protease Do